MMSVVESKIDEVPLPKPQLKRITTNADTSQYDDSPGETTSPLELPRSPSVQKDLPLKGHLAADSITLDRPKTSSDVPSSSSSSSDSIYSPPQRQEQEAPVSTTTITINADLDTVETANLESNETSFMRPILKTYHLKRKGQELQISEHPRIHFDSFMQHRINGSMGHIVPPKPLKISTSKYRELAGSPKSGILGKARDSLNWGIDSLTTPTKSKSPEAPRKMTSPESAASPASGSPTPDFSTLNSATSRRKRNAIHLTHSPLSPLPEEDEPKIQGMSAADRRVSTFSSPEPEKPRIISNTARKADGPDTPLPKHSGLTTILPGVDVGDASLQGMLLKAKKSLRIKSADERRRNSLKRTISVVGTCDQSPDGRVTEWI